MNVALRLLVFTMLIAGAAQAEETEHQAPRDQYWCASVLKARESLPDRDRGWLITQLDRLRSKVLAREGAEPGPVLERIALVREDVGRLRQSKFPVRHVVVGEQPIREYLANIRERARQMEDAHPTEIAIDPVPVRPESLLRQAGWLGLVAGLAGAYTYGAVEWANHHYYFFSLGFTALAAKQVYLDVIPKIYGLYLSAWDAINQRFSRTIPRAEPARLAHEQIAHADRVVRALDEGAYQNLISYAGYTVSFPLRVSDAPNDVAKRSAPSVEQITESVRRYGYAPLPADARQMVVDQVFYFDEILRLPVLLTFAREPGYAQDLSH